MRRLVLALALLTSVAAVASAQDAIPNLKGTWTGKGNSIVFGANLYHPGAQTTNDPPRVHEIEDTYVIDGQDGRLIWGHASSTVADTHEPFAWAMASDNKTIEGADVDGYYHIMLLSPDRMEKCYTQNSVGGGHSIVATCHVMSRVKR
jgi:hypothetical protein